MPTLQICFNLFLCYSAAVPIICSFLHNFLQLSLTPQKKPAPKRDKGFKMQVILPVISHALAWRAPLHVSVESVSDELGSPLPSLTSSRVPQTAFVPAFALSLECSSSVVLLPVLASLFATSSSLLKPAMLSLPRAEKEPHGK